MEIDKRASILRKISNERLNKHLKNKIGSIQKVLVEGNAKGFTEDYSKVSFEEGPEIGEIINMKIEKNMINCFFCFSIRNTSSTEISKHFTIHIFINFKFSIII